MAAIAAISLAASFLSFVTLSDPLLNHAKESLVRLMWVDGEANIPSWFSSALLLAAASLLAIIAAAEWRIGGEVTEWWVLSLIFLFLSLDETAQLHELAIVPVREWTGASGFLYYAWVLPAGICVGLFSVGYLRFLRRLPARTRSLLLWAGAIYVGGALGVESLSGWQAAAHGERNLPYHLIVTAEESCEMIGVVLFIYALLDYLGTRCTRLGFQIRQATRLDRP